MQKSFKKAEYDLDEEMLRPYFKLENVYILSRF